MLDSTDMELVHHHEVILDKSKPLSQPILKFIICRVLNYIFFLALFEYQTCNQTLGLSFNTTSFKGTFRNTLGQNWEYVYNNFQNLFNSALYYNWLHRYVSLAINRDFPGGSESKESSHNAGDPDSIPGLGRSPGEENGYLLQYSCLENYMDRG